MSRRVVRRAPLSERIAAYLHPLDWLLWAAEEFNSNDWEDFQKAWGIPIGAGLNLIFLITRANSGGKPSKGDDVFGDYDSRGSGWLVWFCRFVVHFLAILSTVNASYAFFRRRHYRFFERSVEELPATPSARRVRVDSSPLASSPLRFLYNAMAPESAESRAHPDASRQVTELAIWDPTPLSLRLFCLFSPAHVLIYWSFLPLAPLDPWPSVTIAKTILMALLLSAQGHFLATYFSQLTKDTVIIHKEVLHEYDTKYVHPSINRPARDVGIQTPPSRAKSPRNHDMGTDPMPTSEVDIYSPYTIINRGFHTNPNPSYAAQFDPDNVLHLQNQQPATSATDFSSPLKPPTTFRPQPFPSPQRQISPQRHSMGGDGGSLGVYSHAASPLRKTASTNYLRQAGEHREGNGDARKTREGSPLKRMSTPGASLNQRLNNLRGDGSGRRESGRF
ncbi:hypothetical protein EJ08DRAFT_633096 [Tothia fuscella]|uniref:Meiotically up-regulated gene 154 protein n=1 Tax=Tothia fuscella TaxID=1048955 RepID=A0A9P4TZK7_9PEZI|nr:hypothetical protein EJ08DRAFT_633096 [Tothia fuscella]